MKTPQHWHTSRVPNLSPCNWHPSVTRRNIFMPWWQKSHFSIGWPWHLTLTLKQTLSRYISMLNIVQVCQAIQLLEHGMTDTDTNTGGTYSIIFQLLTWYYQKKRNSDPWIFCELPEGVCWKKKYKKPLLKTCFLNCNGPKRYFQGQLNLNLENTFSHFIVSHQN